MTPKAEKAAKCMLAMQRHSWEQGVCAQALYEAGREDLWIPMAYDAVKRQNPDGRLALIGGSRAVSDPAANGEVCLRAYERTRDETFLKGAQGMLDYLENRAPRTKDGIICHNLVSFEEGYSPRQLWIDGLYMVPPFLAVMGKVDEAAEQIRGYIRHLQDPETGLFFHIRDTDSGRYVRKKRWATGNGWALMGLARVIEEARRRGHPEAESMTEQLRKLLEVMLRYQLPDGRFHDLLDEPESFPDGTSAMMTAATIYRGIRHGYLDPVYAPCADQALRTVAGCMDEMGMIHGVCGCPDFVSEGTSAEAQAAFVMAEAWKEKVSDPS